MARKSLRKLTPTPWTQVKIRNGFWADRQAVNAEVTLRINHARCKETGRIDAIRLAWSPCNPSGVPKPHIFWDSDVAKWIEGGAYSLAIRPDAKLRADIEEVIDLFAASQQPDGYLNSYFTAVEPDKRWTNLKDLHELYCSGHLMEAAVAWQQATGQSKLLDVMRRNADHIAEVFGRGDGQKRGYPGHPEIELALVKLYHATGQRRYLELATYFVTERGAQPPHYYDVEAKARGVDPARYEKQTYDYCQAHAPLVDQKDAVGHAVRALYLYAGAVDVAAQTNDRKLLKAMKRLWASVVERQMYVTGGVGPDRRIEGFSSDYDLPNQTAYAETCAAIALLFFAHRLLQVEADARYADVIERCLYNGVLSGVSLSGDRFFYVNPLASAGDVARREWFDCSCCPTNIVRILGSLGSYLYATSKDTLYVHQYVEGEMRADVGGLGVKLRCQTRYPWRETVKLTVTPEAEGAFTLALRLPGWCRTPAIRVNGRPVKLDAITSKGYAHVSRKWTRGEKVELSLPMPIERVEARPEVRANAGRIALQRGPVVYCLEEADNGVGLDEFAIPSDQVLKAGYAKNILGGVTVITGRAERRDGPDWQAGELYRRATSRIRRVPFTAVPYCVWNNREQGEMLVWLRET